MQRSAEVREKKISALKEDIASFEEQLLFKNKRRQQAESVRKYKLCEEITEEIQFVMKQKRELSEELSKLQEKDRKAQWYRRKNGFVLLAKAFRSAVCSHSAKQRVLRMPLAAIRVGTPESGISEVYLFELIQGVDYHQFLHFA